ncbi:MAG: TRAP transporter substrate-binding protein DctP [Spirochaetota bacterium]|nr:TRAP transporter substrate-binding protein DctP [Spirochaetota bacterium]
MKSFLYLFRVIVLCISCSVTTLGFAEQIKLKLGTLGPKETIGGLILDDFFKPFYSEAAKNLGHTLKLLVYYGGVMGDDLQMLQKARMGQLDVVGSSINGTPSIAKGIEVAGMAYLIETLGQFDFVMRRLKEFTDLYYEKNWICLSMLTEGRHDLYMREPYLTIKKLRAMKGGNYTGGPDDTFFKALGIPQVNFQPPEYFTRAKAGLLDSVISPSIFNAGAQIYTALTYIMEPTIRFGCAAMVLTKERWSKLPWDFKTFLVGSHPFFYYVFSGFMRDADDAFLKAMCDYGSKIVVVKPDELKSIKELVYKYREEYLGTDKEKRKYYNKILKAVKEYKSGNPIEKRIYERDPTYKNFKKTLLTIERALKAYRDSGSKAEILALEKRNIIEKWRLYDWIVACEKYIKSGNPKQLRNWMNSFFVRAIVDELFTKHMDCVKKLYGSHAALKLRINEYLKLIESKRYKGFHKGV